MCAVGCERKSVYQNEAALPVRLSGPTVYWRAFRPFAINKCTSACDVNHCTFGSICLRIWEIADFRMISTLRVDSLRRTVVS